METQDALIEQKFHPNGEPRLFRADFGLTPGQEDILYHLFVFFGVVGYIASLVVTAAIYYSFLQAALFAQYNFLESSQLWENHVPGGTIAVGLVFYTALTIFFVRVTPRRIWIRSKKCWGKGMTSAIHLWCLEKRRVDSIATIGILVMANVVIILGLPYANPWALQYHRADDSAIIRAPLGQPVEVSAPEFTR